MLTQGMHRDNISMRKGGIQKQIHLTASCPIHFYIDLLLTIIYIRGKKALYVMLHCSQLTCTVLTLFCCTELCGTDMDGQKN